jgi:hypothetical protein
MRSAFSSSKMRRLSFGFTVTAGVVGLSQFAAHVWRSGAKPFSANIGLRSEVRTIYITRQMLGFAVMNPEIRSQDELSRLLGDGRFCYAVVFRTYQRVGFTDTLIPHRLGDTLPGFAYSKDVLMTLTDRPPAMFANSDIVICEHEMSVMRLIEGLRRLSPGIEYYSGHLPRLLSQNTKTKG